MSRTKDRPLIDKYVGKYLDNSKVEWLMEYGKIRESVYFKGATGDRYTIYIGTKRNKSLIDFHSIYNSYDHGTTLGDGCIATLDSNYILTMKKEGNYWYRGCGNTLKQLMRQGVMPKKNNYDIRWCRSAYFMRFRDKFKGKILEEVSPWIGMKLDLKTGRLVNMPTLQSVAVYNKAKDTDTNARKANYASNKNNKDALERYKKAGGDTQAARARWTNNGQNVNQAALDPTLVTMNWDMVPMDDCFKHRNATLRSNIIEHYGMNAIIATLEYDVVDEDTIDGREYRLLDVVIPDESIVRIDQQGVSTTHKGLYLEMINPSTGESHFEGVANAGRWNAPKEATVKEALKWRDGDDEITSRLAGVKSINENRHNVMIKGDGATLDYIKPEVLT
jgi:hypothetical protein